MKSFFNILFVGPLHYGSTCNGKLDGLIKIGNMVDVIDTSKWLNSNFRLVNSFTKRTYLSISVLKINLRVIKFSFKKKYELVWIEKGEWLYPFTLYYLKNNNSKLINYNTDNIFFSKGSFWLHRLGIKYYDLYLTTNRLNVIEIKNKYQIKTMRVGCGFDSNLHYKDQSNKNPTKIYDLIFIGHWEPHTEKYILELKRAGIKVNVWGHNWRHSKNSELRMTLPLNQVEFRDVVANAKIALCFLSRWNMNESTGRSFEIPAIGTFMLAQYTNEHFYIYGSGAAFFSSIDELIIKAKYYLKNENEREQIALLGNRISLSPGYSWSDQLSLEWESILFFLNDQTDQSIYKINDIYWNGYRQGVEAPISRLVI